MTIHATAAGAIKHSEKFNEIAMCKGTPENHAALAAACDGSHSGYDYWADDPDSDDKMIWRVNTVA